MDLFDLVLGLKIHRDYQKKGITIFQSKTIDFNAMLKELYASPVLSKISPRYISTHFPGRKGKNTFTPYFASIDIFKKTNTPILHYPKSYADYWIDDINNILTKLQRNEATQKASSLTTNITNFSERILRENASLPLNVLLLQSFNTNGDLSTNLIPLYNIATMADIAYILMLHTSLLKYDIKLINFEKYNIAEILNQAYSKELYQKIPKDFQNSILFSYHNQLSFPKHFVIKHLFNRPHPETDTLIKISSTLKKIAPLLKTSSTNLAAIRLDLDSLTNDLSNYLSLKANDEKPIDSTINTIDLLRTQLVALTIQIDLMEKGINWLELKNFTLDEITSKLNNPIHWNKLATSFLKKNRLEQIYKGASRNQIKRYLQKTANFKNGSPCFF